MFKREMRVNFKSFALWTSCLVAMFLVVFMIYPSIVTSSNIEYVNELLKIFPEDILKAFNMDITGIDTAFGWLKSEGYIFILLVTAMYSGIIGSTIVLKEKNDKTIEYLNSLPVSRKQILRAKILSGLIYVILMTLIVGIFNYIALKLSGDFDEKSFILLSITPIFPSLVIYSFTLFISLFFSHTKNSLGIGAGIAMGSYMLQIISEMSEQVAFLKYFTPFTLADARNVMMDIKINPLMILIACILTFIFIILTYVLYQKKELI